MIIKPRVYGQLHISYDWFDMNNKTKDAIRQTANELYKTLHKCFNTIEWDEGNDGIHLTVYDFDMSKEQMKFLKKLNLVQRKDKLVAAVTDTISFDVIIK